MFAFLSQLKKNYVPDVNIKCLERQSNNVGIRDNSILPQCFYSVKIELKRQDLAVQRVDNTIHQKNRFQVDKCQENKLQYPLDSDLSSG